MRQQILIFGGTREGRQVSDYLCEKHAVHTVCVATEYGEEVLQPEPERHVHQGRMNEEQMCVFLRNGNFAAAVDATHPYAVEVSGNIREACMQEQVPYLRYLRAGGEEFLRDETGEAGGNGSPGALRLFSVDSAEEAADYLEKQQGGIFLTTGSKELHIFTERIADKSRLFARVLPSAEVIAQCRRLGLEGRQICAMQGPFSAEVNTAMIRQTKAEFLVTKETGSSGGFPEKLEAVRACGITAVVIRRPEESGSGWDEVRSFLDALLEEPAREAAEGTERVKTEQAGEENISCQISCIGIGMGTMDTMTYEAAQAICKAEVIFGAERMLKSVRPLIQGSQKGTVPAPFPCGAADGGVSAAPVLVPEYSAEKILAYLREHPACQCAAILMSGDVGFYSGAQQVAQLFPPKQVHYYCGISSVAYFASKIPTAWQDARLLSAHGKELALLNYVRRYRKIILLPGGAGDVERLCRELIEGGMEQVRVTVGSNLSYPEEKIAAGRPADFCPCPTAGLHVMMVENSDAGEIVTPGIPDDMFVRGKVPMTKEEIRILSVAKLHLKETAVVYDVGAGTGSVAVECARLCTDGKVYAVERRAEGIALIRENSRKIGVSNLIPVEGSAPEALEELPVPTHAFIGGSSGRMRQIVAVLREKNPSVRIVINTISMESIAEVMALISEMGIADADIVQISAAKSREAGSYHLMTAHNPVYIVSFGGEDHF